MLKALSRFTSLSSRFLQKAASELSLTECAKSQATVGVWARANLGRQWASELPRQVGTESRRSDPDRTLGRVVRMAAAMPACACPKLRDNPKCVVEDGAPNHCSAHRWEP